MLTKSDRKFITELLDERFKKNNEFLVKDVLDLFNVTNSRIDKTNSNLSKKIDDINERIDKVLDQLRDDDDESINDHEKRIEKIEEKVFITTTSS